MGGRGGQSLRDQSGAVKQASMVGAGTGPGGAIENGAAEGMSGVIGPDGNMISPDGLTQGHAHGHGHSHGDGHGHHHHRSGILGCCAMLGKAISGPLLQILGLDRFTKGKAMSGMARAGRGQNPFDLGLVQVRLPRQNQSPLEST